MHQSMTKCIHLLDEFEALWQRTGMTTDIYPPAKPEPFEQILLGVIDMPALAKAAVEHFLELGASIVKIIWCTSEQSNDQCECIPNSALNEIQSQLLQQARQHDIKTEKKMGRTMHSLVTLTNTNSLSAYLYIEYDTDAKNPRLQKKWQYSQHNLALRCQSVLQSEKLRLDIKRLSTTENLQRALFAISDLANSEKATRDVLYEIHQIVGSLMYADNFFIVRYDRISNSMRFIYFADSKDFVIPDSNKKFFISEMANSLTVAMLLSGRPIHGPSTTIVDQYNIMPDDSLGPESFDWLGVPMINQGEVVGGVVVQSYDINLNYSDEDQALLAYVAQHILTALERREAQEELEHRVNLRTLELQQEVQARQRGERLQQALFRIAEVSQSSETIDQFYAEIHQIVGELLHAKNFYIAFLTDDKRSLDFRYFVDEYDKFSGLRTLGHGLSEYVIRTAHSVCLNREEIDSLARQGKVTVTGTKSISWLGVPLLISKEVIGIITLQSYSTEYYYKESDKELVSFVAAHIANALERRLANENLRIAYNELEQRVLERTQELALSNTELRDQISVRERAEMALKHETLHDSLTGLPNRSLLLERLRHALNMYHQDPTKVFAVLFLDLDRFKIVNDSVGHLVGDQLLIHVAKRISRCIREPDLISRLGGDEFAVLLENIHDQEYVTQIANRIIRSLNAPIRIVGKELFTSVSIGITFADKRYLHPEELLRDADVAMYRAKASGRKRFDLFDETLHVQASHALDLENDLCRALPRYEFLPYYQPIVQLHNRQTIGFEALIRWNHPIRGILRPIDFIDVAADTGNIEEMDWQIYEQVCKDTHALMAFGSYITVNVSPLHLRNKNFAVRFLALLDTHQVNTKHIRLEITEGALLDDPEQVHACLLTLQQQGVDTLLDDFGTGYSSLSYLHRFPLAGIKIDRSFVSELSIDEQAGSSAIIRAICLMAESLGLLVIAEGVETQEQCQQLQQIGLTLGQGYLFAMPESLQTNCAKPNKA